MNEIRAAIEADTINFGPTDDVVSFRVSTKSGLIQVYRNGERLTHLCILNFLKIFKSFEMRDMVLQNGIASMFLFQPIRIHRNP